MKSVKIAVVVGTRPNFIKITQLESAFRKSKLEIEYILIHTGQHFDDQMSNVFFKQLELKKPEYQLTVKSISRKEKILEMQESIFGVLKQENPNLLIVVGDVDSTYSAAMAAKQLGIKIAHLESGLRSFDERMPEEVNRIAVDQITDIFFVTEQSGLDNLNAEGVSNDKVHFVGNTMIDTLVAFDDQIQSNLIVDELQLNGVDFVLVTIHRPSNVDNLENLTHVIDLLERLSKVTTIVLPIHPRTRSKLKEYKLLDKLIQNQRIIELGPIDYLSFQKLILTSKVVITDSGGIQEETTFRKVPCLTIRENTERPSTIALGTNQLLDLDVNLILQEVERVFQGESKTSQIPPLWDGAASQRIVKCIEGFVE